ncbi:MAG: porin [Alphaproteobacteria bacterium]
MKKSLLATTALAALGAVAVASPASAKFDVSVSGYMEQWFGYTDSKESVQANSDGFSQFTDSEFFINFSQTLDNGLKIGGQIQVEGQQTGLGEMIDEQFIYVNGSFGRLELGTDNAAHYRMHYGIKSNGIGIDEGDAGEWVAGVDRQLRATNLTFVLENDENKVTYFSPRVSGFQVGASYIPEMQIQGTPRTNAGFEANANRDNAFSLGGNYVTDVADMSIKASIGYMNAGGGVAGNDEGLTAGLQLGFGGFTASFAYGEHEDDTNTEDVNVFGFGIAYNAGPAGVSVGYIRGEDSDDNDKQDAFEMGASYQMGPGVTAKGSVYYVERKTAAVDTADGVAVAAGLALSF